MIHHVHAPAKERSSVAALIRPPPCACVDIYFPTALATSAWHVLLVRTVAVSTSSAISDFCTSSNCGRITFNKSTGTCSGACLRDTSPPAAHTAQTYWLQSVP